MSRLGLGRGLDTVQSSQFAPVFGSSELWTPAELSTDMWLLADDATNFVLSGSAISQWTDMSGNSRHLTQATGTRQPLYDSVNKKVTFDFTDLLALGAGITGLTDHDFYSVRKSSNSVSIDISASSGIFSYVADDASVSTGILGGIGTPSLYIDGVIGSPTTRDDVHTLLNTGSNIIQDYTGCDFTTWTEFQLSYATTDFAFAGEMREVILVGNLSTDDRQKVEGYLAWKWDVIGSLGLVAALPIGHPYKSAAPRV